MRLQHADWQMDTATVCTDRVTKKKKKNVQCNIPKKLLHIESGGKGEVVRVK